MDFLPKSIYPEDHPLHKVPTRLWRGLYAVLLLIIIALLVLFVTTRL